MSSFETIDKARQLLQLPLHVRIEEIRQAYLKLSQKYHPDHCAGEECAEMFRQIHEAYETLMEYAHQREISFSKEEVEKTSPDEMERAMKRRFYDGWLGKADI